MDRLGWAALAASERAYQDADANRDEMVFAYRRLGLDVERELPRELRQAWDLRAPSHASPCKRHKAASAKSRIGGRARAPKRHCGTTGYPRWRRMRSTR